MDALTAARVYIRLVRALEARARWADTEEVLTLTELGILGQIERGCNLPSAIARALALDPGRVTRITDRLFSLGYVQRESDPDDRRRCPLRLTEAGVQHLEGGRARYAKAMEAILGGLTEGELEGLSAGTSGLARVLDDTKHAPDAAKRSESQ